MDEQPTENTHESQETPQFRLPADVVCAHHPDAAAAALCERCGDLICALCCVRYEQNSYCATCRAMLGRLAGLATRIPWEFRKEIGFFRSLYLTIRMVISNPREFFRAMPPNGELNDSLLFVLVVRGTGTAVAQVALGALYGLMALATQQSEMAIQAGIQLVLAPFTYIAAIINAFILASVCHLALRLMTPRWGFGTTFRVHAYAAAIDVFNAIPFIGAFIVWPWSIYLHVVGFQEVQGMSVGRAVLAALAPTILFVFVGMALFGLMFVIIAMAGF